MKYTDRTNPWSTISVTSHPAASSRFCSCTSAASSGRLNERWSNWIGIGSGGGEPAPLSNVSVPLTSKKATVFWGAISKK